MCFDWVSSPTRGLLWMFSPGKFLLLQSFTDWRNIRLCRYPYIHLWLYFTSIATGNAGNALILGVYLFTWNGLQSKSWHDFSKLFLQTSALQAHSIPKCNENQVGFLQCFCFCFGCFWDLVSRAGWGFRHVFEFKMEWFWLRWISNLGVSSRALNYINQEVTFMEL